MKRIIVYSWASPEGGVWKALNFVLKGRDVRVVNLAEKNFSDYDSHGKNSNDDFLAMAEEMVQYDQIILACPVYWYSVPAIMKRFIDRWSDLLGVRKDIGRKLQGKKLFVVASYGTYPDGIEGFELPLKNTARYMYMDYGGCLFYYVGPDPVGLAENKAALEHFRFILGT